MEIKVIEPSNPNPFDICWNNLKEADTNYCLEIFCAAAEGWSKLNPTKNYQDFEKELRDKNFNTYLIAGKPKIYPGLKLLNLQNNQICQYECIYSCRPKSFALQELLEHWPTYKENFNNLSNSGRFVADHINNIPLDKDFKKIDDGAKNFIIDISENKIIIKIIKI